MAKKLLALLLAMCMVLSVCAFNVFAEGEAVDGEEQETEATDETQEPETEEPETEEPETEEPETEEPETEEPETQEPETEEPETEEPETQEPETEEPDDEEETVKASVTLELENSYLPNEVVTITGTVKGDVSVLDVVIICEEDDIEEEPRTISASKFESTGFTYSLRGATVGAEYEVKVYDNDTDKLLGSDSFLIKKGSTPSKDDGSNEVTIWIEGADERYIDETVVDLDDVKKDTVLGVAEYVLKEADRAYKANKQKITAISYSETSDYYDLKDNSTSSFYKGCKWGYFIDGVAYYDVEMCDMEVVGGNEIVLYYGVPGEVGYPKVTMSKKGTLEIDDEVTITVECQITDIKTGKVTSEPIEDAEIYFVERGSDYLGYCYGTTDEDGEYELEVTSYFLSNYQNGRMLVALYESYGDPMKMVSVTQDLKTGRSDTIRAYVRIEGAHETLLERTSSSWIEEYDLYNFMLEFLDDEDIEYEVNDDEVNFTYFESDRDAGFSNENGDLDGDWYVAVNDDIYGPDDDLEEVEIYEDDEILFYFGDKKTIPVVYVEVDGDLEAGEKVYVYFYSDKKMKNPIEDLEVNFEGENVDKDMETNEDGRITLPTVKYRGTYTLSWGEKVGLRDDECPNAVYGSEELWFTGDYYTGDDDDDDDDRWYDDDDDDDWGSSWDDDDDWGSSWDDDDDELDKWVDDEDWEEEDWGDDDDVTGWEDGDTYYPQYGDDDFVAGPSKYYPDTNIDAWAVEGINKAREYSLMSGTTYGYFEPQRGITRAEFTTIVCRMLGLDTDAESYTEKFNDVKESDWYFGYVMAAQAAGYINGMSETTFAPNNYITREEIAVLVSRIISRTGAENDVYKFADGTSVSAWARIYVVGVSEAGIIKGDQFNQFLPKANVNRQTAATIAVRLYEYLGLAQ